MGFYIRKSVSVGPFRFNLSKSGIGVSAGITGLRLGKGPRGTYVHAGRGGVYYRKTLSSEPGGVLFHAKHAAPPEDASQATALDVVDSGSVLHMVDADSADVLRELNLRPHASGAWLAVICIVAVVGGLFFSRLPWWYSVAVTVAGLLVIIYLQQRNNVKNTVAMLYHLEPEVEQAYSRLHQVFDEMTRGDGAWLIEARGTVLDSTDPSNAMQEVRRRHISITTGLPPNVRSNLEAPIVPVGKQTLYFLPDMLLVYENENFGAVGYRELEVDVRESLAREEGKVSSSEQVEEIHLSSKTGLNELLQVSRQGIGVKLKNALTELTKFSDEIKADIS